jgi:hypothetical protein
VGNCCVIPSTGRDCKQLIRLESGKTLCRIFRKRIGSVIDRSVVNGELVVTKCFFREDVKQDYLGCPWNE